MESAKKIRNSDDAIRFARVAREKGLRTGRVTVYFEPMEGLFYCLTKGKEAHGHEPHMVGTYAGEIRSREIADDINFVRKQKK